MNHQLKSVFEPGERKAVILSSMALWVEEGPEIDSACHAQVTGRGRYANQTNSFYPPSSNFAGAVQ